MFVDLKFGQASQISDILADEQSIIAGNQLMKVDLKIICLCLWCLLRSYNSHDVIFLIVFFTY